MTASRWLGFEFAALLGLVLVGCGGDPAAQTRRGDQQETERQVKVLRSAQSSLPRIVEMTGTLAAEQQVDLGMKTSGRLSEILVDLGTRVKKDDALARMTPIDFELRVQQADAALQQARARLGIDPADAGKPINPQQTPVVRQARALLEDARLKLERAQSLSKKDLLPRSELDAAESAFKVAESRYQDSLQEVTDRQGLLIQRRVELEIAQQQLADSVLRAPFQGVVRERHAAPGQFVTAGEPIVTLVQVDPLRLRMSVPEREATDIREGLDVRITVSGDEATYKGRIARLGPAIEESSRTLSVEAEVPNSESRLRPGAFASAEIVIAAEQPAMLVPVSAVVTFAGIEKLITVKDGESVEKVIRTGRRLDGQIEVLEGLAVGEDVVVEPGNLVGGQRVSVQR